MNFKNMFEPETMAVIGVSLKNNNNPANVIFNKNNLRHPVKVFPVNPAGGYLQGEKVYGHITEIPEKIDLAVIAVRADLCPSALSDCIQANVQGAVIISGGFAEAGGSELQDKMVEIAREKDFPFIGPNCLGIYSPTRVDTFFLPSERMVRPDSGSVAIVSQSGGVLVDQMVKFSDEGVGLSLAISIGNKALIGELEMMEYLASDPQTKVMALYIEGFEKNGGRKFVEAASKCPKPVIVLKAGKSSAGIRAVSSHTASLAGDYETFSAVLAQYGIVEAKNEFELVAFCESLSCYSMTIQGKIGIVTGSGGHGALAVDVCTSHDLIVPQLSDKARKEIKDSLSPSIRKIASVNNPIDLTGSSLDDDFFAAAKYLSRSPEVDCVIILLLPYQPGITSDLGARLSQLYRQEKKPLIAYVPHVEKYKMLIEGFEFNQIPVSQSIQGAVHMASALKRSKRC